MLSEVTSLLFVYVCDTDVTSGFDVANPRQNWIRYIRESGFGFGFVESNTAQDSNLRRLAGQSDA